MIWDDGIVPNWWTKGEKIHFGGNKNTVISEKELVNNNTLVLWGKSIFLLLKTSHPWTWILITQVPKIKLYSWTYTAVPISQNHQIIFKSEFNAFSFGSQNNVPPGASGGSDSKESACNAGDPDSILGLGRSPGEGNGNPLQCSCLENPHGQRSPEGYSSWSCKELEMTEQLTHTHVTRTLLS